MKRLHEEELIAVVLASFEAEKNGDVEGNIALLTDDFVFTDLILNSDGSPFRTVGGEAARELMKEAFQIQGREFIFKSICANEKDQTVSIEFIESYPDPDTGKTYRTPQVAIVELRNGLIYHTRHYMDPRLSHHYLTEADIAKIF